MNTLAKCVLGVVLWVSCCSLSAAEVTRLGTSPKQKQHLDPLPLAGTWRFALDPQDVGPADRWFERDLVGRVELPGSLPAQGIGDVPSVKTKWTGGIVDRSWYVDPAYANYRKDGNVKVPFWLTPDTYYAGAAWYQRDILIPASWSGKRIVLSLERPHWETRVWIDDKPFGTNNSLATPHDYDLGQLAPGKHKLTIRVDNRMVIDIGENSHSISDHTQGNWNGIVGRIELRATPLVWIEDVQVFPDTEKKNALVKGTLGNATGRIITNELGFCLLDRYDSRPRFPTTNVTVLCNERGGEFQVEVPCGNQVAPWDESNGELLQRLYELTVFLDAFPPAQTKTVLFGFRDITTAGSQFLLNGKKTFFRGTLDCCIYPKTGHPPTDVESWRRVIRTCQAHGLNLIRFHSWCPPEAAFIAADELGFYLQVEASSWANQSTTLGDGKPVDNWIYAETDRILKYYGNHPSFLLMPYGNEPGGKNHAKYLAKWVSHYKAIDPRRLWTAGAGWPQIAENQFHLTPDPRIQGWGEGLKSRINSRPPETTTDYRDYIAARNVPVISHEIGQWCVYPNFDEIPKYTGYLKPRNFEIYRDSLKAHYMGDLARSFLLASGKLQLLCYKEDIESALRTPGMGGFQLLDLHDFPGQGTALVGILDPFWESKGYSTPEEFRRFCNAIVPLARLPKRVFTTGEQLQATFEAAHFADKAMSNAVLEWQLIDASGKVHLKGRLPARELPIDNAIPLGALSEKLNNLPAPARYKLTAGFATTRIQNDWDVWIYPPTVDTTIPDTITLADELTDDLITRLQNGATVLLAIPSSKVAPDKQLGKVALGFSPIFWNTAWTKRQAPHTLGVLVDPAHPLFAHFPTEFHSNWQWWYIISRAEAMILDHFDPGIKPAVQVIDDWVTNRKLALLVEGRLGKGRIIISSIDLETDLADDPVRRQFRHSLIRYMAGDSFKPTQNITHNQLKSLLK